MLHHRQHIADMAVICQRKGIQHIVVSPGSRSAPIIRAFYDVFGEDACLSVVDERSAAYYALGIASFSRHPVLLICTSGTAVLNYAPALAEAYYQHVPLIAVTADRPAEWIDQQENQTIRQTNIYNNYIKGSYLLPQAVHKDTVLEYARRIVCEAIDQSLRDPEGPVHINVPLAEPLYDKLPAPEKNIRIIEQKPRTHLFTPDDEMIRQWVKARRIMIVHGQDVPGNDASKALSLLQEDERTIVMAENISNITGNHVISTSSLILSNVRNNNPEFPDLIIHSGGHVVSKALTSYLRSIPQVNCWRIGINEGIIDTFGQVTRAIPCKASAVYRALADIKRPSHNGRYKDLWLDLVKDIHQKTNAVKKQSPFCDLHVFNTILPLIPPETNLILGNSSIIRYSQLFPANRNISYYSNRGVSGIDGSISTAAGIALASEKPTLIITGDQGMIYDSNALWNKNLPSGLKILVINNGGGGIFHILKGPSEQPHFKKLIEAHHPVNIHKLAEAFGITYFFATDEKSLSEHWHDFISQSLHPAILEVQTNAALSAETFRKMMGSGD